MIGEIKYGREIGKEQRCKYIWWACIDCGKERWVRIHKNKPLAKRCKSCQLKWAQKRENGHPHNWQGGISLDKKMYAKKYRKAYREKRRLLCYKLKLEALTHYGGGRCACVKCGESRPACLSIDHIGGCGAANRQNNLYFWLKSNNYPAGYQTLCMNCQFVKRIENGELVRYGKLNNGAN